MAGYPGMAHSNTLKVQDGKRFLERLYILLGVEARQSRHPPGTFALVAGSAGRSTCPDYRRAARSPRGEVANLCVEPPEHLGQATTVEVDDVHRRAKEAGWAEDIPQVVD